MPLSETMRRLHENVQRDGARYRGPVPTPEINNLVKFTPRFGPHVYIDLLEKCGAPMIDVKRFRDILEAGVVPSEPATFHGDAHRSILHRELGFDPGPLQMLLRMAAKQVNYQEMYSAPPQKIIDSRS